MKNSKEKSFRHVLFFLLFLFSGFCLSIFSFTTDISTSPELNFCINAFAFIIYAFCFVVTSYLFFQVLQETKEKKLLLIFGIVSLICITLGIVSLLIVIKNVLFL